MYSRNSHYWSIDEHFVLVGIAVTTLYDVREQNSTRLDELTLSDAKTQ